MAICGIFVPGTTKWTILAPSVIPVLYQANISPEFSQFMYRAADSMTKGVSPFLSFFVIYLGYLNIYNNSKESISIKKSLSFIMPYFSIICITWFLIVVLLYLVGLPIGPSAFPTM